MRFGTAPVGGARFRRTALVVELAIVAVGVVAPAAIGEGRLAGSTEGVAQMSSYPSTPSGAVLPDRRTDAFDREAVVPQVALYLDANERGRPPTTVTRSPASSGEHLDWPQLGIAFLLGAALVLGLVLVVRSTRQRSFAH